MKVLPLTRSLAVTITSFTYGCWLYNVEYLKIQKNVYRIDANTTADSINTEPRINSNRKAPKFLNLNNTTASWLYRHLVTHFVRNFYFMFKNFFQITHSFKLLTFLIQIFNSMLGTQNEIFFHLKIVNDVNRKYCTNITYKEEKTWSCRLCAIIAP